MVSRKQARADRKLAKELDRAEKQARLRERVIEAEEPRAAFNPAKSVRQGADPSSIMQMIMTFDAHGSADREGAWTWGQHRNWCASHECQNGGACEVSSTMMAMSALKWSEILQQRSGGHQKHHDQELSSIVQEAQDRWINDLGREEDMLFRFRTTGKGRIWGYRNGPHFSVVWWDAEHQVYPVEKKNT